MRLDRPADRRPPAAAGQLISGAHESMTRTDDPAVTAADEPARRSDALGFWCGGVMICAAALIPLVAWLSPLGFAPLMALVGLLCAPAFRISEKDRPLAIVLICALAWGAASLLWSPFANQRGGHSMLVELSLAPPLYWCAVCGARRADPGLIDIAFRILAFGLAAHAAILLADVPSGGEIYRGLHQSYYEPISPVLAKIKLAQTTFVLAVLWPLVLLSGGRGWTGRVLLGIVLAGVMIPAYAFDAAAPLAAVPLSLAIFAAVLRWPRGAPRLIAWSVGALYLASPAIIWSLRWVGSDKPILAAMEASWAARVSYWIHTTDWIMARPLLGWGLDASRHMGPGIVLHPHNNALQAWLELGLPGAAAAAAFWLLSLGRTARAAPSPAAAASAAAAGAYLLFAWVNFGLWQQWWIALGALVAMLSAAAERRRPPARLTL